MTTKVWTLTWVPRIRNRLADETTKFSILNDLACNFDELLVREMPQLILRKLFRNNDSQ